MIYVDKAIWTWRNKKWCHMVADNLDELHDFALQIGLKKVWFQVDSKYRHYDITEQKRELAIKMGAIYAPRKIIIEKAKIITKEYESLPNIKV